MVSGKKRKEAERSGTSYGKRDQAGQAEPAWVSGTSLDGRGGGGVRPNPPTPPQPTGLGLQALNTPALSRDRCHSCQYLIRKISTNILCMVPPWTVFVSTPTCRSKFFDGTNLATELI